VDPVKAKERNNPRRVAFCYDSITQSAKGGNMDCGKGEKFLILTFSDGLLIVVL